MKHKNAIARSLVLLLALFSASVFVRAMVAAGPTFEVTVQPPDKSAHLLGETVRWSGSVEFFDGDSSGAGVTLVIEGPRPVTQSLSVVPGTYTYPTSSLVVTIDSQNVTSSNSTLPGGAATRISYDIEWTPPYFSGPATGVHSSA